MSEYSYDDYDYDDEYEEQIEFCSRCTGTGRIPALDYEAIQGHSYFACPECEAGLNSGYPWKI